MRRLLISLVVTITVSGSALGTASVANPGAEKAPLVHNVFEHCSGGFINPPSPLPIGFGFALINATEDTLIAKVSLKNALPDTTYHVALTQLPSTTGCNVYNYTLTTNSQGNGNVHIEQPLLPGTTGAFIDLWDFASYFYNSPVVVIA